LALTTLHTKYRPKKFADVIGQDAVVKSLQKLIETGDTQSFLFSGPSGTGKTTLARICARELGCETKDILEIDAATNTGVESMRTVQESMRYRPFGDTQSKAAIIDEAHMLSKSAFNSLLKATEEPLSDVYWFFCTTEPGRVPATIKTRCASYSLKSIPDKTLGDLYDRVCDAEKIDLPGDVGDMIIREAHGSARQLLVHLSMCREVKNKQEAADLLKAALAGDAVLALCQMLATGKSSWAKAMAVLSKIEDEPEGVRIVVMNYMAAAVRGATSDRAATYLLSVMDAFASPYNPSEKQAPLLLSVGRVLLGQ
jgi:DNA polymerase-3 subunit gamma/tau